MDIFEKIKNSLRFFIIVISPKYKQRKNIANIFRLFLSGFFVVIWVSVLAYYLAWNIIANNVKKNTIFYLNSEINNNDNIIKINSFDGIHITGFPFNIDISFDKIVASFDFINTIEINNPKIRYFIFDSQNINLVNIGNIVIEANKNAIKYNIVYNETPKLDIIKNKNNSIHKIIYSDKGYKVIDAVGNITDSVNKNIFEYESMLDIIKNNFIYEINFETQLRFDSLSDKSYSLDNVDVKFSISGENIEEKNRHTSSVNINNFNIKTAGFSVNGYGSILNSDKNTFKINISLSPYKNTIDFIANYLLNKPSLFISTADVGKYYSAINNIIKNKMQNNIKDDVLNLLISKDKEGDITINKISLEYIFFILSSARYNVIYENPRTTITNQI